MSGFSLEALGLGYGPPTSRVQPLPRRTAQQVTGSKDKRPIPIETILSDKAARYEVVRPSRKEKKEKEEKKKKKNNRLGDAKSKKLKEEPQVAGKPLHMTYKEAVAASSKTRLGSPTRAPSKKARDWANRERQGLQILELRSCDVQQEGIRTKVLEEASSATAVLEEDEAWGTWALPKLRRWDKYIKKDKDRGPNSTENGGVNGGSKGGGECMLEPNVKAAGDLAAGPSEFYIGDFELAGKKKKNNNKDKKDKEADSTAANGSEADAAKYRTELDALEGGLFEGFDWAELDEFKAWLGSRGK
ncbi:unnamed protein product, partial [Prorocentrum cordatum]